MTCALPPLDQTEVNIARGFGLGYNRDRSRRDQLHAGMDFVASTGAPVLAPVPGVVDFVSRDTGPRINVATARSGGTGQVRGMGGYGNAVVLRHEFPVPGLPNPFWTSYNHLSALGPGIAPGARVQTGQLLGQVGNTTNGQFRGMGAHLHMELRRVEFPGNYNRDTMDPAALFTPLGIEWVGGRTEVERRVGGQLLLLADGPSGPAACPRTATGLAGLDGWMGYDFGGFGTVQQPYVDPSTIRRTYSSKGTTQVPRVGTAAADVMPPDYASIVNDVASPSASGGSSSSTSSSSPILIGAGVAGLIVIAGLMKGRR